MAKINNYSGGPGAPASSGHDPQRNITLSWDAPRGASDPITSGNVHYTPGDLGKRLAMYGRESIRTRQQHRLEHAQSPLTTAVNHAIESDIARDKWLLRTEDDRRAAKWDRDGKQIAALNALPDYLRVPLIRRVSYLRHKQRDTKDPKKATRTLGRFLHGTLSRIFTRLENLNARYMTRDYCVTVARERLDELLRLPELNKRETQLVATLTAGAMDSLFARIHAMHGDSYTLKEALATYQRVARMAMTLNVVPPSWEALRTDIARRSGPDLDKLPGAIARLTCATWWQGKLWRLRRVWREEQLRAAGLVSKTTSAYISQDALVQHREQRRRMREFLKSYELVNDDGFTIDLEDVYYASNSNPKHRRIEMMVTTKGMQQIAEENGDEAMFLTVTCPSRFHATLESGQLNPKWDGSTIRDSSNYLVNIFFAAVRKKLNRKGLHWYGVRVAEPNHDGTVHWHMLIFCRPAEREAITNIVRDLAIQEDRTELGNDITPRFKSVLIDKAKGDPVSYIAAYIGKNIDSDVIGGIDPKTGKPRLDHESNKPMAETVEHAIGWAGLHGVRQFQFFGIPSRQTYRELRRLAVQMSRNHKGPQSLPDKAMDDVLVAADAGCFASYIDKQGGVLTPRSSHIIRTAYDLADKPNDYGETHDQIYGIYSPWLGETSRICTHPDNWELVRKKPQSHQAALNEAPDLDLQGVDRGGSGAAAPPWTRGNNCPFDQKAAEKPPESERDPPPKCDDFEQMTPKERRSLLRWIRKQAQKDTQPHQAGTTTRQPTTGEQALTPERAALLAKIDDYARSLQLDISRVGLHRLAMGQIVQVEQHHYRAVADGALFIVSRYGANSNNK